MLLGNLGCLLGIVAGAIVLVGIPHVGKWGLAAALGIGSLFMLPYFLYDILSKDLVRVRVLKEELYFDFNNREYCKEFEMMNGAASGR